MASLQELSRIFFSSCRFPILKKPGTWNRFPVPDLTCLQILYFINVPRHRCLPEENKLIVKTRELVAGFPFSSNQEPRTNKQLSVLDLTCIQILH